MSNLISGSCRKSLRSFPDGKMLPCLSLVDLHSLVQCWSLPHLCILLGPSLKISSRKKYTVSRNALPTIPFQMTLLSIIRTTYILIFLKILEISFTIEYHHKHEIQQQSVIHSSVGADLAFKGTITLLHSELVFSKARDSINFV